MKRWFTLFTLLLLVVSPFFASVASANDFKDHQMAEELSYWVGKGVIQTDAKGNVSPDRAVTRGEFASYLARSLELPVSTKFTFKDLKAGNSRTIEIQNAAGAGILGGYPDGSFKANQQITRQQMAGMIYKAFRYLNIPVQTTTVTFKDSKKISPNFVGAVSAASNLNIIRGDQGYFKPTNNATIAHASAFLFRMFAVADQKKPSDPDAPPIDAVDPEVYKISSISNGQLQATNQLFSKFEDALASYNASSSVQAISQNNKIIKMKSGQVFAAENPKQYTSLYSDTSFKKEVTYIQKGYEMDYIGSSEDRVIVGLGGYTYYAKHSEVDLVPTQLSEGSSYYKVTNDGLLVHYPYYRTFDAKTKKYTGRYAEYTVGPASSAFKRGQSYTSNDGVHFKENGSRTELKYYPYFQFQSIRQPSTYTGQELDRFIASALAGREQTGIARYKNATKTSKLVGLGTYIKASEKLHGVNAMFILAAAIHESDYGMSANAQTKNNIFGIRVFDSSPDKGEIYADPTKSIDAFIGRYMNLNYANPFGAYANGAVPGNKAVGFNMKYASDPFWGSKIAGHMWRIDQYLGNKDANQAELAFISYTGSADVNIRTSPEVRNSSNILFSYKAKHPGELSAFGYPLVIVDRANSADGYVWYKVLADTNPDYQSPSEPYGWIRSDLVTLIK
ncbi:MULTISPECIES: S-layer homology domain-containing protein [unclassified Sporosarcina]|uniref:S-layer homology domain-containing protein n=1 Tax=unclassified Sporosarcina TaxID=2647733 RepID=UPI00203CEBE9|nr:MULTISPECIES: S-layer homology domain-containing protein [unclassified Sporosarcina]GKV64933.1 glucosaminidase [Sporosarcina sp. NCCP-2331]GLB55043.1 glucosaminidase [Sporosarcina sp. NCCP-2378]